MDLVNATPFPAALLRTDAKTLSQPVARVSAVAIQQRNEGGWLLGIVGKRSQVHQLSIEPDKNRVTMLWVATRPLDQPLTPGQTETIEHGVIWS